MRLLNTPIMIDSFQHHPGITTYLLSHLHTDHTSGLSPSWNNGIIYTTKLSAQLLKDKFHVDERLIVELEYDECVYVDLTKGTVRQRIPSDAMLGNSSDGNGTNQTTTTSARDSDYVTNDATCIQLSVIDANHCVGSCMFLLEGYFGTILATGDFRFDKKILRHHFLQNKVIDHLYLDDTFAEPEYVFPSRAEAGKEILSIIQKYPDYYRICVATDTLGKEELLVAIAMKFKSLVVVSEERLHQLNCMRRIIQLPDVFTSDQSQGRIICLGKRQINFKSIIQMRQVRPTIGILPSGWSQQMLNKSTTRNVDPLRKVVWRVGYSLHSSFPELETFVRVLKPRRLHSGSRHDEENLSRHFAKYCSPQPPREYITPKAIQDAMVSKVQQQAAIVTPRRALSLSAQHRMQTPLSGSASRRSLKPFLSLTKSSSSRKRRSMQRGAKIAEIIDDSSSNSSLEDLSLSKPVEDIIIINDSDDDDSRGALSDDEDDDIQEIIDVEALENESEHATTIGDNYTKQFAQKMKSGRESAHATGLASRTTTRPEKNSSTSEPAARSSSIFSQLFSNEDEEEEDDEEIARILGGMFAEHAENEEHEESAISHQATDEQDRMESRIGLSTHSVTNNQPRFSAGPSAFTPVTPSRNSTTSCVSTGSLPNGRVQSNIRTLQNSDSKTVGMSSISKRRSASPTQHRREIIPIPSSDDEEEMVKRNRKKPPPPPLFNNSSHTVTISDHEEDDDEEELGNILDAMLTSSTIRSTATTDSSSNAAFSSRSSKSQAVGDALFSSGTQPSAHANNSHLGDVRPKQNNSSLKPPMSTHGKRKRHELKQSREEDATPVIKRKKKSAMQAECIYISDD